jgi:hypothetical protein
MPAWVFVLEEWTVLRLLSQHVGKSLRYAACVARIVEELFNCIQLETSSLLWTRPQKPDPLAKYFRH